jgi:carbamoyl-phosphate synthase large subunit
MHNKNILITSSGNKQILVNYLKESFESLNGNTEIICCDSNSKVLTSIIADGFFRFDDIQKENILAFIEQCKSFQVGLVIPGRNVDAFYFSKYIDLFRNNNIEVLVSDHGFVSNCIDKFVFSEIFQNKSKSILKSFTETRVFQNKFFVAKERFGSGSVNLALNLQISNFSSKTLSIKDPIFQEMIFGTEFSADLWFDRNSKMHALSLRVRTIIDKGEAIVCEFIKNEAINIEIEKIFENEIVRGPINLQGFITLDREIKIFEINPRLGGAFLMSEFNGFEVAKWINNEYILEQPISEFFTGSYTGRVYKRSYYEEF